MTWPANEDQWAAMCSCERPSELNMSAAKLNELIMPDNVGDAMIDLRALSLREWSVEFLWKLKVAQLGLKVACVPTTK